MSKYNLLEYSDKYCIDVKDNVSDSRSFKYKTRITRRTEARPSKSGNEGDTDRSGEYQSQHQT